MANLESGSAISGSGSSTTNSENGSAISGSGSSTTNSENGSANSRSGSANSGSGSSTTNSESGSANSGSGSPKDPWYNHFDIYLAIGGSVTSPCMLRVSPSLLKECEDAYVPRIVCIGPYHRDRLYENSSLSEELCASERIKKVAVSRMLVRILLAQGTIQRNERDTDVLSTAMRELYMQMKTMFSKDDIKRSYVNSEVYRLPYLGATVFNDACFILEFFRCIFNESVRNCDDLEWLFPNFGSRFNPVMRSEIMKDLIKLENQIPLSVLEDVLSKELGGNLQMAKSQLQVLVKAVFSKVYYRPFDYVASGESPRRNHILDIYYYCCLGANESTQIRTEERVGEAGGNPAENGTADEHRVEIQTEERCAENPSTAEIPPDEAPAGGNPAENPADESSAGGNPGENLPAENQPDKAPAGGNPAENPADESSAGGNPGEIPVDESSAGGNPGENPADESPAGRNPAANPLDDPLAGGNLTDDPPARGNPAVDIFSSLVETSERSYDQSASHKVPSAVQLKNGGVEIKGTDRVQDIKFKGGALYMPPIQLESDSKIFIRNLIALEMCSPHFPLKRMTTFVQLMHELCQTEEGASVMREKGIIVGNILRDSEITGLFSSCRQTLNTDAIQITRKQLCNYYTKKRVGYRRKWNEFWDTYGSKPWLLVGGVAVAAALALNSVQVYCLYHQCQRGAH